MSEVSQLDVAPTVAAALGFSFKCLGEPIGEVLSYARGCSSVLLVILDGLGYLGLLEHLKHTSFMKEACMHGILLRCRHLAQATTPAIASILTGLPPDTHGVQRTEEAYTSRVESMPEIASKLGFPTAVVMEPKGAKAFQGRVDYVLPVREERADRIDLEAAKLASEAARVARLVVLHLRSVDKLGYSREAFRLLDYSLKLAYGAKNREGRLLLACGDHPPHGSSEEYVPLLAYR